MIVHFIIMMILMALIMLLHVHLIGRCNPRVWPVQNEGDLG